MATELVKKEAPAPGAPARRVCFMSEQPSNTAPCDYAISLSAIAMAGAAALLLVTVVDFIKDFLLIAVKTTASQVGPPFGV